MTNYTVDESVILAALEKDPKIFKSLENPSEKIISYMVRNQAKALISICKEKLLIWKNTPDYPTELFYNSQLPMIREDLEFAINQNAYSIELLNYWHNDSDTVEDQEKIMEEICLQAVTKNGLAIKFIDDPAIGKASKEVQLAAVTNNPDALLSITNPHIDAVKKALELKPELFKKMENITEKVAVTENKDVKDRLSEINAELKLYVLSEEEFRPQYTKIKIPLNDLTDAKAKEYIKEVLSTVDEYYHEYIKFVRPEDEVYDSCKNSGVIITEYNNQHGIIKVRIPEGYSSKKGTELLKRIEELYEERHRLLFGSNKLENSKSQIDSIDFDKLTIEEAIMIRYKLDEKFGDRNILLSDPQEDNMSLERIRSELSNIEQQFFNHPCNKPSWAVDINVVESENLLKEFHTLNTERNRWLTTLDKKLKNN